jgi:hypothetical protein
LKRGIYVQLLRHSELCVLCTGRTRVFEKHRMFINAQIVPGIWCIPAVHIKMYRWYRGPRRYDDGGPRGNQGTTENRRSKQTLYHNRYVYHNFKFVIKIIIRLSYRRRIPRTNKYLLGNRVRPGQYNPCIYTITFHRRTQYIPGVYNA